MSSHDVEPLYSGEKLQSELAAIDHDKYRISYRDELFLAALLNPDSKTYRKAPESLMAVDTTLKWETAQSYSYQILGRLRKSGYLRALIETLGGGIEVRVRRLAEIASGRASRTVTRTDSKGNVTVQEIPPTYTESIAAIKELNIIDGTRSRAEIAKRVMSDQYKAFSKALSQSVTHQADIADKLLNRGSPSDYRDQDEEIIRESESVPSDGLGAQEDEDMFTITDSRADSAELDKHDSETEQG